jgi:LysM repeat protein
MFYSKRKIQLSPRLRYGVRPGYDNSKFLKIGGILFLLLAAAITLNTTGVFKSDKVGKQQVLGATDTQAEAPVQQQFVEHVVKKGDTLFNIGQQYKVDWTKLMQINNLDSPTLKTGQKLKIPTK